MYKSVSVNSEVRTFCFCFVSGTGKAGQMAADLDMEAAGGEGWGDDAELTMDEGELTFTLTAREGT